MPGNGSNASAAARRDEHVDDTRRALLAAARRAFAKKGYSATSLEDIVGPARLTKGALYHHFESKAAVLEAVYIAMSEELVDSVTRAVIAAGDDGWAKLVAALEAFFDASTEPEYVRIVLREAPHVLGNRHGRDIDQSIGLAFVSELVTGLQQEGLMPPLPVAMTARILIATTGEIAMTMADASDPAAARREGTAVLMAMLEGMRAAATPRRPRSKR